MKAMLFERPGSPLVWTEVPDPRTGAHELLLRVGAAVDRFAIGDRVGVPWLGWPCGTCRYCCSGRENLCDRARFTGYDIDGGYAELTVADPRYCFALPAGPTAQAVSVGRPC